MKKTLVTILALVFVLGIASAAFAAPANPFVDVPAKHWAYGAVAKLAKAGVVDGYGDGTFRGDKLMSRYEMAQVVAKAMAKSEKADAETKALIDKLAVEFAAELNNLGVRVAKLEKNASTIKFGGDARLRWVNTDKASSNPSFAERFRLVGTAQVNDTTSFYFRDVVLNHNGFGTYSEPATNYISDVKLTVKEIVPNIDLTAGRYSLDLGQTGYLAGSTGGFDGIEANYKNGKASLKFGYADSNTVNDPGVAAASMFAGVGNIYYGDFGYKFTDSFKMNVNYVKDQLDFNVVNILGAGITWKMGQDWMLVGDYWRNSSDAAKIVNDGSAAKATVVRLQYKTLKSTVPGSWMAFVEYLKLDGGAIDANWSAAMVPVVAGNNPFAGLKGYDFQYSYTLAKNLTADVIYSWDLKNTRGDADGAMNAAGGKNRTRVQLNFMF